MKIKHFFYLSFIIISIVIQSCATAYIPNRVNSPLFEDKNEFKSDITLGRNGYDVQTAYSPIKGMGVMLNGCFSSTSKDTSNNNYHSHKYAEAALGYYMPVFNNGAVFEVYAGYGMGQTQTYYDWGILYVPGTSLKADFTKMFVQPAIGINKRIISLGFASRFSLVQMNLDRIQSQYFTVNDYDLFWEPAITLGIGKKVKFVSQMGASLPIIALPDGYPIQPRKFMFSVGIELHLGAAKEKKIE